MWLWRPHWLFLPLPLTEVISAIFLKDTLDAANNDAEHLVRERLQSTRQYVDKLEAIFKAIDTTGDGMITEDCKLSTFAGFVEVC